MLVKGILIKKDGGLSFRKKKRKEEEGDLGPSRVQEIL